MFYSFFIFLGTLTSLVLIYFFFQKQGLKTSVLDWAAPLLFFCGIVGARLGEIFYSSQVVSLSTFWKFFLTDFLTEGGWKGLSIFGGLIFGSLIGWLIFWHESRKTKTSLWIYADCIFPSLFLAQAIGRWGNYFNAEILGPEIKTNFFINLLTFIFGKKLRYWGESEDIVRHPLFFYESIFYFLSWIFIVFIFPKMFNKDEKDTVPGVKTGLYFYFLGFFRLTIDFLRPDSFLSFFSVSNYQKTHFSLCISLVTIYIGILVIIYLQENFNQKNQIGNQPINIKKI